MSEETSSARGSEEQGRELIQSVAEIEGRDADGWGTEAGFEIKTDRQTISLMIDNDSSCCEEWGYLMSEDDTAKFVGAALLGVRLTDTNRSSTQFFKTGDEGYYEADWDDPKVEHVSDGEVMFVNIETDRGVLQFVAYNSHNGYYGHEVRVKSEQLTHSEVL